MDDKQAVTFIKTELTWLQKHERLMIVFLVLLVGVWLGNKYLNNSAAEAQTKYSIAAAQLEQTRQEAAAAKADYQMTLDALTKQNASLAASVAQRQVVLAQRQTEIQTLPLPQVATRWQELIGGANDIVSSTMGLSISDGGARRTVSQLEQVPVLVADKADLQKIADNKQIELDKAGVLIVSLSKQVKGTEDTCKLQVDAVKAQARKSKRNWFIAGFVSGIATRLFAHF
jgi:hypothetical protein